MKSNTSDDITGVLGAMGGPVNSAQGDGLGEAQWMILDHLSTSDAPLGARSLTGLLEPGFPASEATVSRWLLELDQRGLTRRLGSKGRVATAAGIEMAATRRMQRAHQRQLAHALDLTTIGSVIDLLVARRAVESEAARMAARRITPEELRSLEALLGQHRETFSEGTGVEGRHCAMEFHRVVVRCSGNPMLTTLGEVVLGKQLDYLERVLDMVTLSQGSYEVSAGDHETLLAALADGDETKSEQLMRTHLTRLIDELEAFRGSAASGAFSSMLKLIRQQG